MLENFPCSDMTVLTCIVRHPEIVNYRKILKSQKLRESVLFYILELQKDNLQEYLQIMIQNQMIDVSFLSTATKQLPEENKSFTQGLYNIAFLRTLKPQSPKYLAWNDSLVIREVVPNLSLDQLASSDLREYFPEFVQFVTRHLGCFTDFSWYLFVSNNSLNDTTLGLLEPVLNCLEYWHAFNKNKKNLSKTYIIKNESKLLWWKQLPSSLLLNFSERCLSCSESTDLYKLLQTFVSQTKWSEFLNNERLPEWLIEVLARFKPLIERQLNGVSFWWKIGRFQKLSSEFIDVHANDLELKNILIYQTLSTDQLERFVSFYDNECWHYIARNQSPSPAFLEAHAAELTASV